MAEGGGAGHRVWCVVCGVWCVVCGVWCVVCGVWCVCMCLPSPPPPSEMTNYTSWDQIKISVGLVIITVIGTPCIPFN